MRGREESTEKVIGEFLEDTLEKEIRKNNEYM